MKKVFLFLALFALVSTGLNAQLKFIAHRGASWYAPENTLASIRLAWELGSDGAECDIRLTKDGQVILWHDGDTGRLTGVKKEIATSAYRELKDLTIDLRASNSGWFEGQHPVLLRDVLSMMKMDQLLVIEIKSGNEIFLQLKRVLHRYFKNGRIAFIAFGFETICQAKSLFPEIPCYWLSSNAAEVRTRIPDCRKYKLEGVDLNFKIIDKPLTDVLRTAGLETWCWTVDDLAEMTRLSNLGITVITTNRPTWLKEQAAASGSQSL